MNTFDFNKLDQTQKYLLIAVILIAFLLLLPYTGIHLFSRPMPVNSPVRSLPQESNFPVERDPFPVERNVPAEQPAREQGLREIEELLK